MLALYCPTLDLFCLTCVAWAGPSISHYLLFQRSPVMLFQRFFFFFVFVFGTDWKNDIIAVKKCSLCAPYCCSLLLLHQATHSSQSVVQPWGTAVTPSFHSSTWHDAHVCINLTEAQEHFLQQKLFFWVLERWNKSFLLGNIRKRSN